ncbi:MAG: hypothetical protein REI12_06640, partial [Pedobacter sp.]|nr:hypothetical protein [Pedobacter sp.]
LGTLALVSGILMSHQAYANTAGGATIHNFAKLTYAGNTTGIKAAVNVAVQTVAALPTVVKSTSDQTVPSYGSADYTFTVTSASNGVDTFSLNLASTDSNTVAAPGLSFLLAGSPVSSLTLGGSVSSAVSGAGTISIPAGSQSGLSIGDTVVVAGNLYTISNVTAGSVATTDIVTGVSVAEVPTVLALTPVGASPAIAAGAVAAGSLISEQVVLTQHVVATAPASSSTTATHTVSFTGTSTATDLTGATLTYNSATAGTNTITTVTTSTNALVKLVRNTRTAANAGGTGGVSCGADTFYAAGVVSKPSDQLQYCLRASVATGATALTGAVIQDDLPPYTSYVTGSTTLNGAAVTDGSGGVLPLTAGLPVNSPSAPAGEIQPGAAAVVIFSVTVQ